MVQSEEHIGGKDEEHIDRKDEHIGSKDEEEKVPRGKDDEDKVLGGKDDDECIFAKLFNSPKANIVKTESSAVDKQEEQEDEVVYEVSFPMRLETLLTAVIVFMVATTMIVSYSPTLFVSITMIVTIVAIIALYFTNPMYAMTVLKRIMLCTHMSSILLL